MKLSEKFVRTSYILMISKQNYLWY